MATDGESFPTEQRTVKVLSPEGDSDGSRLTRAKKEGEVEAGVRVPGRLTLSMTTLQTEL